MRQKTKNLLIAKSQSKVGFNQILHIHCFYQLCDFSQNIRSLISYYYKFILEILRLYSRNISTLFSKCFDFILVTFRLYSRNISTLFSKCFDFILVTFRLYSRSVSTLFS